MEEAFVTYHILISGMVQGIGFRSWTKRHAKRLRITGWVKNREDGAVEAMVQGQNTSTQVLLDLLHHGPPLAAITSVVSTQIVDVPQYEQFIVIQ